MNNEIRDFFRKAGSLGGGPATVPHKEVGFCRCAECRRGREAVKGVRENPASVSEEEDIKDLFEVPKPKTLAAVMGEFEKAREAAVEPVVLKLKEVVDVVNVGPEESYPMGETVLENGYFVGMDVGEPVGGESVRYVPDEYSQDTSGEDFSQERRGRGKKK